MSAEGHLEEVADARRKSLEARDAFYRAVLDAHEQGGATVRAIAAAAGVSSSRVGQILQRARDEAPAAGR